MMTGGGEGGDANTPIAIKHKTSQRFYNESLNF